MTALTITRDLAFPVERVWHAFTSPAALAAWFWPQRFAPTAEAEVRVGGRYRIDGPGAGMAVSGEYTAVEPPRLLAFTWVWDGDSETTLVTIVFTPTGNGTELTLRHEQFTDAETRQTHEQGWRDCLDRLPGWLDARQ